MEWRLVIQNAVIGLAIWYAGTILAITMPWLISIPTGFLIPVAYVVWVAYHRSHQPTSAQMISESLFTGATVLILLMLTFPLLSGVPAE
ncbi:MAG: hypothetical protein ACE5NC_00905 [Anaerolineae bacterium]